MESERLQTRCFSASILVGFYLSFKTSEFSIDTSNGTTEPFTVFCKIYDDCDAATTFILGFVIGKQGNWDGGIVR